MHKWSHLPLEFPLVCTALETYLSIYCEWGKFYTGIITWLAPGYMVITVNYVKHSSDAHECILLHAN